MKWLALLFPWRESAERQIEREAYARLLNPARGTREWDTRHNYQSGREPKPRKENP